MIPFPVPSAALRALLVLPLLLATLACLPALVVLPFLRNGGARTERIVRQLIAWTRTLVMSL
ncbi:MULTISPECIES: hypothetical protein [Streptomyces]|uniref:hypothetical protein n=1 Tax=Streptomyces TaxID=1883 RepID=UPI000BDA1084|nr:hypothetical protein [Streptomyces sp. Ag109_G2-15]SOD89070.1 hypothetical protein SAMN06272765_5992 [Streptomyces sp. Ag109_G2-15]